MKFQVLILCIFWLFLKTEVVCGSNEEEDYYWQEYTGDIPKNALPGGNDMNGAITYIGQTMHRNNALIPGEINAERKILSYAMEGEHQDATSNIKILCVNTSSRYEWIDTNATHIRYLTQKHLIAGGYDDDYPLLIGRIKHEGAVAVGKITTYCKYEEFAFTTKDTVKYVKSDYQVLVYQTNSCPCKVVHINFYQQGTVGPL